MTDADLVDIAKTAPKRLTLAGVTRVLELMLTPEQREAVAGRTVASVVRDLFPGRDGEALAESVLDQLDRVQAAKIKRDERARRVAERLNLRKENA